MQRRMEINLYFCAAVSLVTVLLLFYDELNRRLGDFFLIYCVMWGISIFVTLFLGLKLFGSVNNIKLVILTALVAYLSGLLAYILAVVNINLISQPVSMELLLVSLVFPFLALRGWVFFILFVSTSSVFKYFSQTPKYKDNK